MNYISVVKENFLNTPIDYLKGVGPNRSEILKKEFQIFTLKIYFIFSLLDILIGQIFIKLKK